MCTISIVLGYIAAAMLLFVVISIVWHSMDKRYMFTRSEKIAINATAFIITLAILWQLYDLIKSICGV